MPWNCLCSSKDKRKPEISAPILNNEDIQKLQLIPLKKPLITSEHLQQKLVQPENNNSTTVVIVDAVPDCDSSHLVAVTLSDDKSVQKKQSKQLNKKQKEKQNNKAKPSNLKKQLPSTSSNNVENEKISKQLTNVKFAFEVNDIHYEESKESGKGDEENAGTGKTDENKNKKNDDKLNDNNGNYDELPLIRIEEFGDATDGGAPISKKSEHFSKSSESIPFIDESPRHQPLPNLFETRYITIQPQNIGSQSSKNTSNNNSANTIESIHTSVVPKREQFDKSAQILYQSQIQLPVAHHFEMVQRLDVKLCQVCHEFLLEPKSVRCLTCGFVCHESCVATKPKIRYTDTSYIIFQQWQKGGGKATFPIVSNFAANSKFTQIEGNKSLKSTESAVQQNESLAEKQNGDIIANGSIRQKTEQMNGKKLKKRRSRSLDRKRNKRSLVIDDSDESLYDGEDIDVVDHSRSSSMPVTSNITVDVHRANSTSVCSDSVDAKAIKGDTAVPENTKCDITLDINHNNLPLRVSSNSDPVDSEKDVINSVQVRRKEFHAISDSSSFDESSDQETGYATVQRDNLKNYDAKTQQSIPKSQSFPLPSQYQKSSDNLGLNYVTERILGSVLPRRDLSDMHQHQHRPHSEGPMDLQLQDKYEKELILMLEQKHGKNYKMFDLESCISTITLEKLCELCKHIDSWLGSGREKVVVLQDRGDKQRLGAAIAAYLKYLDICAANYPKRNGLSNEDIRAQNTIARNWLDLDMFSMRKFLEDVIGPLRVPSHCRYLNYFSGLLSGKIKMNSSPLQLKYVTIESPPSWMNYDSISTQSSEWKSFIKIYEGLNCVFTSDIHVIPISTRQFVYEVGQLRLRGDVIIRCYQLLEEAYQEKRELMFSTQFHTCAVTDKILTFTRSELDYACDDPRFPSDHKVTLHFGNSSANENRGYNLKSPLVTIEPMNAIAKYDSLEHFDDALSPHTHGPLDGSLYATILKSPKTPERSSSTIPQFPNVNNNTIVQTIKPIRGSTQNLISPPPEFSNNKKIEITERLSTNGTVYPIGNNNNSVHNTNTQIRSSSSLSNRYTPTPSINYEEIRVPSRSSSREIVLRNSYSHQTTPRPTSSQSQYQDQRSSVSRTSNYTPNPSSYPPTSHQVKTIESYHYSTVENNNNTGNSTGNYQDGRESVRSPLTLSMDSGISSSGIVNRRVQGSSVSPSSFPSQTSPQEDRQRELDDILSDMLLTVQDIPDIVKCKQYNTLTKKPQQNNQIILTQHQQQTQSPYLYNTDTVKRSHTSSCSTTHDDHHSIITSTSTTNQGKDRDFYDTSSTTTTITPPPSESGRDTPIIVHTNSSNNSTLQHRRDKRESSTTHMQQQQHRGTGDNSNREQIMDLQNQSFAYPQQVRTDIVYVTSEDEEIPYHAREDSRPFTYGNPSGVQLSPNGTGMLKMQSGLSSPSLVRKTLGGGTTPRGGDSHKKTNVRNDFEEMLLQRREKVLNEKYSIGDKTPNGSAGQYGDTKWSNLSSSSNGYHYHEPLKRSNTMDGGFGRSYSTDETSGQTWLQLQQQKLRAKKEQQTKGADYFERKIHTEIRNRPLRSRSSAAHRYDGYASDTAAFDADAFIDEVDYRRPLHVQTPHNRSSDRNYHTITTTTTTTKERPFVSVKRAHEQAKLNTIGSSPVSPLSVLNASPLGHISQAQSPNGLLSFADSSTSPRNGSGHVRLESEILTNGNDKSAPLTTETPPSTATTVNDNACGQMALDRLLKSLAVENNKIDEHLDQLNNGNSRDSYRNGNSSSPSEIFKFPPPIRDKNHNKIESNNNRITTQDSLNDVIANLTDFTRHETLRQSLTNGNSPSLVVNNNRQYLEPTNNAIKRLASESENSSSISPSLSERSNGVSWSDQVREESFSSYRSETEPETSIAGSPRPETPAFPVTPRTPYGFNLNGNSSPALPPKSPTSLRRFNNSTWSLRSAKSTGSTYDWSKDLYSGTQNNHLHQIVNQNDSVSCYTSRRNSTTSNANSEPQEVAPHLVKFVRDSSKYWYKPNISREEAVALLRNAPPGTFIVRDSTTFAKAYGLVVKVAYPPPGVQTSKGPPGDELVRHFLVEPTTRGVRLKGCSNEPVFTSLSALVYQHSITPLALPCRLIIPDRDMQSVEFHSPAQQQLITQGAACNVLYLFTCETESLTGPEAVRKAISFLYSRKPLPKPTEVHFKVSHQGITLTDQTRQLFFRKHYPSANISHCGLDPEDRRWSVRTTGDVPVSNKSIFAFVARRSTSSTDNQCHVFCELEPSQPATAITSFTNKIIPTANQTTLSKNI